MTERTAESDIVTQIAREGDRDRYLSALYAPRDRREALLALYAFDAETASLRARTKEPLAAEIRLQWWRDSLAAPPDKASGHPIADRLRQAIRDHDLPIKAFDDYLAARVFDLYDDPIPDKPTLEGYCGETSGAVVQLACMILDREAASTASEAAGHAGCVQAMTMILRRLAAQRARGQCFVPIDLLSAVGTTSAEFIAAPASDPRAQAAVSAFIALANEHLAAFRRLAPQLPGSLRIAFLPLSVAQLEMKTMHPPDAVLQGATAVAPWRRQLALMRAALFS